MVPSFYADYKTREKINIGSTPLIPPLRSTLSLHEQGQLAGFLEDALCFSHQWKNTTCQNVDNSIPQSKATKIILCGCKMSLIPLV